VGLYTTLIVPRAGAKINEFSPGHP